MKKIRINDGQISGAGWLVLGCHGLRWEEWIRFEDRNSSRTFSLQHFEKNDSFVVFGILCGVEERGGRLGDGLMQERHLLGIMFQLCPVAGFEFGPSCRVVGEPLSQIVGGCDLFEPQVDAGLFFGQAARPEPVDENAGAVFFGGVVVDSFDLDGQGCFLLR
jgi:hypothetical protein